MKLIEQRWEWVAKPQMPLQIIELAGRTCYKSEARADDESAARFCRMLLRRGHESVMEHVSASVRFITNRSITHELVRHRLASFSQESTRYVDYQDEMEFIQPVWLDAHSEGPFLRTCESAEVAYRIFRKIMGWRPEQAREVLPNALKTEIVMTANLREWRHVFKLRTSKAAHPQMRALMLSCLEGFKREIPVLFDDIGEWRT